MTSYPDGEVREHFDPAIPRAAFCRYCDQRFEGEALEDGWGFEPDHSWACEHCWRQHRDSHCDICGEAYGPSPGVGLSPICYRCEAPELPVDRGLTLNGCLIAVGFSTVAWWLLWYLLAR